MHRVIGAGGGHRVVGATVDVERRALGRVDIGAEPVVAEIVSRLRRRPLLVERRPVPWQLRRLLPREKARISVFIVPQPLAGLAAKQIARLGLGWYGEDMPLLPTGCRLSENTPREIALLPSRLDY